QIAGPRLRSAAEDEGRLRSPIDGRTPACIGRWRLSAERHWATAVDANLAADRSRGPANLHTRGRAILLPFLLAVPTIIAAVLLWPRGSTPGGSVEAMSRQLNLLTAGLLALTALAVLMPAVRRHLSARSQRILIVAVTAANLLSAGAQLNRADAMPGVPADLAAT